jgi:hypothetical protein
MAKHQVIGLIEIDPCMHGDQLDDDTVGETLRRLRRAPRSANLDDPAWEVSALPDTDDAVMSATLETDLGQLHADLECELAKFLERLMVVT